MRYAIAVALLAPGCAHSDADPDCGATTGLVATTTDFSVGALATVGPEGDLTDRIASTSGDPLVRSEGGWLWQINRTSADTLRRYSGNLCRPDWEVALPRGANVHDVHVVGDEVWVTRYEQASIGRRSVADGSLIGAIDLADLADGDGIPELHDLIEVDGRVYVAAQRFDRRELPWVPGAGRIAEIDAEGTLRTFEVGPSPRLVTDPSGGLLVLTGSYGAPDGALERLDPETGSFTVLLTEEELGRDLEVVTPVGGAAVLLASEFDLGDGGDSSVFCVDLQTGQATELLTETGWFVDAASDGSGVWVGVRRGWGQGTVPGLFQVDPVECTEVGKRLETALEPYSLTFVSEP